MLGFPCNQFGAQEPGTAEEIAEFVSSNYGVTFPMFAKIDVNGDEACELFSWLTAALPRPDGESDVAWNFTKFLIDGDGVPVRRFEPMTTPDEIGAVVAEMLGDPATDH